MKPRRARGILDFNNNLTAHPPLLELWLSRKGRIDIEKETEYIEKYRWKVDVYSIKNLEWELRHSMKSCTLSNCNCPPRPVQPAYEPEPSPTREPCSLSSVIRSLCFEKMIHWGGTIIVGTKELPSGHESLVDTVENNGPAEHHRSTEDNGTTGYNRATEHGGTTKHHKWAEQDGSIEVTAKSNGPAVPRRSWDEVVGIERQARI